MLIGSHLYLEPLLPVNLMSTAEHFPENSPVALTWECEACLMAHPPVQHLLCPLGCHDNPPSKTVGDDAGSGFSREGHLWALPGLVVCL